MDIRKIKKLIDLMIESDLQSIEVKEGDQSIALSRRQPALAGQQTVIEQQGTLTLAPQGALERSPMVGAFYAAASPGEAPYVQVGQSISTGDTLGIIEAMKIMNPIESTQTGIIAEILVKNGDVVQFGQPLFRLRNT